MDAQKEVPSSQDRLAAIVNDAFDRTGGDVYETEPPPADSQPAAEQPATEPAEAALPAKEEPTSTPPPKVFNKYNNLEEAERGYFSAVEMGNQAKARADEAEARLARITSAAGPTPAPEVDPLDEIENYGVPKELIAKVVDHRVKQGFTELFTPMIEKSQADQKIIEKYPDYQEHFSEIEKFVESDPDLSLEVAGLNKTGNYLAARRSAYLNWKVAQANAVAEQKVAADSARKEEATTARRDAGVGSTRRADTRTAPVREGLTPEKEKDLLDLYHAGHPAPYLRAKLDGMLPSEFDNIAASLG